MEIAHIEEFIFHFYHDKRSSAQSARVTQAMSRQKTLDKMVRLPDPRLDVVRFGVCFVVFRLL